jgi:hypothetical protein
MTELKSEMLYYKKTDTSQSAMNHTGSQLNMDENLGGCHGFMYSP